MNPARLAPPPQNSKRLSPAQRDLAEAVEYYERAAPRLGLEFLDEIERTVERICFNPRLGLGSLSITAAVARDAFHTG